MSKLYADCQNLAGWISQGDNASCTPHTFMSLVESISSSKENNKQETLAIALKRMPSLAPYISIGE